MMISGDLRDACSRGIGTSQRGASLVQPPQQDVSGRAYAQEFSTTHPQCSLGHADFGAKGPHVGPPINTSAQNLFQPNHHSSMMVSCAPIVLRLVGSETIGERMKQFVFQRPRGLGALDKVSAVFCQLTGPFEQPLEFDRSRARRADNSALSRRCDRPARQCLVPAGEALVSYRYEAPLARTPESFFQGSAATEKNHVAVSDSDP